jgi:predicted nucleic acid-binding Zn ribbon protein
MELIRRPARFLSERRAFILESRMSRSEYTMNIFYIIGVVVVVIFVAGFFGLHA